MKSKPNRPPRGGFTLIELIVSLAAASVLMVGLSSTIYVALRASDTSTTPAADTLEGLGRLSEIAADLEYAQAISEQTATAITVTVPDRNDPDTNPETIRYAWSGTAGDPVTRQYNGAAVTIVVDGVHDFGVQYYQPAAVVETITIRIQVTSDSRTSVETSLPLLNQP